MNHNVIVLGASNNPERYSYQAVKLLSEKGYKVYPIHPKLQEIDGIKVYSSINQITDVIDTITIYLNPQLSLPLVDQIIQAKPRRVVCNPGTESKELKSRIEAESIPVIEACTLVMLRTGQW